MLVSIIVPCFNHSKYLYDRLQSIFNQSYQNFELILLDDASTDGSGKILESYKEHPKVSNCIINDTNSGSTFHQWNKGVNLAKGELIWIAESDDIADKNFLKNLIPEFESNPNLTLAYTQSFRMNANGEITGTWKSYTDDLDKNKFENNFTIDGMKYIRSFLNKKNTIPNASAVIFKRKNFYEVGASDPQLKYIGDWDLWYRLLSKGDIYFDSQCLNYFRYHDTSVISKAFKNNERPIELEVQVILFFKKLLIFFKNDPELNQQLKRSLKYAIKNTFKLALQQQHMKRQYLFFTFKQYLTFLFKLRFI